MKNRGFVMSRLWLGMLAVAVGIALCADVAPADSDHEAARGAVQRGEIRPLADILASVRGKLPGEIAGVEIERKAGRWVYEFRVVGTAGRLFEVYVDARTGEVARIKEK
jgi:uncharacterized membrane protein YkoI